MLRRTAAVGLALALAACKGQSKGPVLAKGDGFEVTAEEFQAAVDGQMPFQKAQLAMPGKKTALLQRMVEDEALFAQAQKEKLLEDPQVQRVLRTVMVQRLKAKHQPQSTDAASIASIPAADIEKYYAEHPTDFEKRLGATIIAFYADPGAPQRGEKRAAAERALAQLRDAEKKAAAGAVPQLASTRTQRPGLAPSAGPAPSSAALFTKLVADLSEDETTKRFGGSVGFKTRAELEQSHPPELAAAIFSLPQGAISDVVETPRGFYIARVTAVREQIGLDQARPHIQMRLARAHDEKVWTDFVKKVRDDAKVTVDEQAVEAIPVSAAPAMGTVRGQPASGMGGAEAPHPPQIPAEKK